MVTDASDQQKFQHAWPLVTMQDCFHHKVKTVIVWYCTFTTARKKSEFWDKVTITNYHLYSMAEIRFHGFHMSKGKKQTNIKMHSLTLSPLPYLFTLFSDPTTQPSTTIPLPLPGIIFSLSDSLCCSESTKPIQSGLFLLVVDVIERASTHQTIPPTETGISYF